MQKRIVLTAGGLVVAIAVVVAIVLSRAENDSQQRPTIPATTPSGLDPLVEEFRATERDCIRKFNDALRSQREGAIDELELSNVIERDVLMPWRTLRTKVSAVTRDDDLYATLRRYLEARQISWEAYQTALRAPSDEAARPHYEMHRQKNADAQEHAQHLGELFRAAARR